MHFTKTRRNRCLAIALTSICLWGCADEDLPLDRLQTLNVYGDPPLEQALEKPLLVLTHFDKLTCMTCVNMHLKTMAAWPAQFGDGVGFITVVNDFDPGYFRNLRRIGGVRGPILVEEEVTLKQGFYVSLYDMGTQELVQSLSIVPYSTSPHTAFGRIIAISGVAKTRNIPICLSFGALLIARYG